MTADFDPLFATIASLRQAIDECQIGPLALTERVLAEIAAKDSVLGAFTAVTAERALREAAAVEAAMAEGRMLGPLQGIPYAVKDLYDVAGEATTAGTRLLRDNVAAEDCNLVRRLSHEGMILVGKTHTTQLASSVTGQNPDFGMPHNPWQREPWTPGGSSSGSAVAVAAGLVPLAMGTDTGGSVRVPAALCGTVGLKTTVGRVSRAGVYPLCPSLDSLGPLTGSVSDAAAVLAVTQGGDPRDPGSAGRRFYDPQLGLSDGVAGLSLAIDKGFFFESVDDEVSAAVLAALEVLRELGAEVKEIDLAPLRAAASEAWWDVFAPEAYGINAALFERDREALGAETHWMRHALRMDAEKVAKAMEQRARLILETERALEEVDALIAPTSPFAARPLEEVARNQSEFDEAFARFAMAGNILALCGVSLPCGFTTEGLPIGMTVYAKAYGEEEALRVAEAYEKATSWHRARPDLSWIEGA